MRTISIEYWSYFLFFIVVILRTIDGVKSVECPVELMLPCDSGDECILRSEWCDGNSHCKDQSDEKYCKRAALWFSDPNLCKNTHFLCENGKCIPKVGRCDGHGDCEDLSDEDNCETTTSSTTTKAADSSEEDDSSEEELEELDVTGAPTTIPPVVKSTATSTTTKVTDMDNDIIPKPTSRPVHIRHMKKDLKKYDSAVARATNWIISKRRQSYGWGPNTPRALIALALATPKLFTGNSKDVKLMKKQLELQIAVDLFRNQTEKISLSKLSLYINALLATCQDPTNFYAINLVSLLRQQVSSVYQRKDRTSAYVNPFALVTLCLAGESTISDVHQIDLIIRTPRSDMRWLDLQSISAMAFSCILQKYNFAKGYSTRHLEMINQLYKRLSPQDDTFENIYSISIALQALLTSQNTQHYIENLIPAMDFLANHQKKDGSFGDFLSTYYILPVLAQKSISQLHAMPCNASNETKSMMSFDFLLNSKGPRHYVRYSLLYHEPVSLTHSIMITIPINTTFFDVMRLAQHIDPKYKFTYERKHKKITILSIGGVPNDAENGIYWHLETNFNPRNSLHRYNLRIPQGSVQSYADLNPYELGVENLIPKNGDHIAFWYKSLRSELVP